MMTLRMQFSVGLKVGGNSFRAEFMERGDTIHGVWDGDAHADAFDAIL